MNVIAKSIISILLAYLLGSILPAYFIARIRGFDIRKKGSGNPGISNAAITMGYEVAVIVAIYDLLKAPLAITIASYIGAPLPISLLSGFFTIIGSIAPFYLKFKGGRGVAASAGIVGYSIFALLLENWHFTYFFGPIAVMMGIIFSLKKNLRKNASSNIISLILLPLLLIAALLFYGVNPYSIALIGATCYIVGERIENLLRDKIKEIPEEERSLLKRKKLRPFGAAFPVGVLFFKKHTLMLLGAVLLFFVILEVVRFTTKFEKFPLRYKTTEKSRVSSMAMFLLGTFLTLLLFPKNIASLAVMFVVFGDLLAWSIGTGLGGKNFLNKTFSGTLACLVTCLTISVIYYKLGLVFLRVGTVGSIVATLVEIAPIEDDNFAIPITSAIIMTALE